MAHLHKKIKKGKPYYYVREMIEADFAVIEAYDPIIAKMERDIISMANNDDPVAYALLKTVPGIGKILGLVILYEIEDINFACSGFIPLLRPVQKSPPALYV